MVTALRQLNDYQLALFKALDFVPTPDQTPIIADGRSEILVCGGERGGKSVTLEKILLSRKKWGTEQRFGLLAADYNRTNVEWEYLVNDLTKLDVLDGKSLARTASIIGKVKNTALCGQMIGMMLQYSSSRIFPYKSI